MANTRATHDGISTPAGQATGDDAVRGAGKEPEAAREEEEPAILISMLADGRTKKRTREDRRRIEKGSEPAGLDWGSIISSRSAGAVWSNSGPGVCFQNRK